MLLERFFIVSFSVFIFMLHRPVSCMDGCTLTGIDGNEVQPRYGFAWNSADKLRHHEDWIYKSLWM